MDLATIIGLGAGFFFIILSIAAGGSMSAFINMDAVMIVFGGSISATMINYSLKDILGLIGITKNAFFSKLQPRETLIGDIVTFAETARREGILAMENSMKDVENDFMKKGLQLVVDGATEDMIKKVMETEIVNLEERHRIGADIYIKMAGFAPGFGMIGTLIGLIQMLRSLDDPTQIGVGMAVALVTTLYGSFMANLICNPIAGKLKQNSANEVAAMELILTGILGIVNGDNPRMVRDTLAAYLKPKDRAKLTGD